jgi:hypothetical protein
MPRGPKGEKRSVPPSWPAGFATGEIEEGTPPDDGKDPAAVVLGRKGGEARAAGMTAKRRKEIAKKVAQSAGGNRATAPRGAAVLDHWGLERPNGLFFPVDRESHVRDRHV